MLFSYFVYIAPFTEFAREAFFQENICSWKNQKRKKAVGEKKKKKKKRNSSKKKERVLICQEKKKNFLCESDWYWRSSKLASRF